MRQELYYYHIVLCHPRFLHYYIAILHRRSIRGASLDIQHLCIGPATMDYFRMDGSEEGTDQGITPAELLSNSLSAFIAYYVLLLLKHHVQDLTGLEIICTQNYIDEP